MDTFEIKSCDSRGDVGDKSFRCKSRIFLTVVAVVTIVGFAAVLANVYLHRVGEESYVDIVVKAPAPEYLVDGECEEEFCSSKGCVIIADRMLDLMNFSVDPCEDFYEYACGNYKKGRSPRFQDESLNPLREAEDSIIVALKKILDNPIKNSDSDSLKKAKIFYSSCTNTERRNDASLDDLHKFLQNLNLSWPVLHDDWQDDGVDWKLLAKKLENNFKIHAFFSKKNHVSDDNPLANTIIECHIPTLPAAAYLYGNVSNMPYIMKMYNELIDYVLRSLGVEKIKRRQFISDIINLETELARSIINSAQDHRIQPSRNLVQILEENDDLLDGVMANVLPKCEGNCNKLLEVLQKQPEKLIKNYLGWRFMYNVLRFLNSDLKEFNDFYIGSFPNSPPVYTSRFRECGAAVRDEMGLMAYKAFIDAGYFPKQVESEVKEMMTEMKGAFASILSSLPWMDNNTLTGFQNKIKNMKLNMGYPEDLRFNHAVDHLYYDLDIGENDTFFANIMQMRSHIKNLMDTGYRNHSNDFRPLDTISLYDYKNNIIELKLGLLRQPIMLFGDDYPKYLKYAPAAHIAHEIGHAFDTVGATFNANGEQEGIDWWSNEAKMKFLEFIGCLQHQESQLAKINISDVDMGIINNDIADMASVFITYEALSHYLQTHGDEEKPLPGLPLSKKKQIYFVQAAQMFCDIREAKPTIDPYIKKSRTGKKRINSAISNMNEFGAVFGCDVGSKMNPANKCNLLA